MRRVLPQPRLALVRGAAPVGKSTRRRREARHRGWKHVLATSNNCCPTTAALINGRNDQMRTIIRTAIVVAVFGAAGLGLANVAVAAPLNDPADHGNCQVAASGPSRNIDIVFPSNDPQEQAIVDYLTKVDNDFNTNTGPGTLDNPRPMQELDVTSTGYTSGTPAMGTQTTVVKVYQNTGGAHPLTRYKGGLSANPAIVAAGS